MICAICGKVGASKKRRPESIAKLPEVTFDFQLCSLVFRLQPTVVFQIVPVKRIA